MRTQKYLEADFFTLFYNAENFPYETGKKITDAIINSTEMLFPANGNAGKNASISRLRSTWIRALYDGMNDRLKEIRECN
jgi:hypothetical protein